MAFFFPPIHADIDWQRGYEFLDKELAKLGSDYAASRRLADKLVKVWLKDGRETWLLIHLEIQGRPEKHFNQRIYVYNYRLFERHNCEVISLVVLTGARGARVGQYEVARWGFRLLCEFPVVRITDYRGREAELLASRNPFALVVLTQLKLLAAKGDAEKKLAAKRELIRALARRGFGRKKMWGLAKFIDLVVVLPPELDERLKDEIAADEEVKKKMPYVSMWERWGIATGKQKGKQELVLRLLTHKLGALDEKLKARLEQLPVEKLDQLGEALLDFTGPQDLEKWLRRHAPSRRRASGKNGSAH